MSKQTDPSRALDGLSEDYLDACRLGLRAKSKELAARLIEAMPSLDKKILWTQKYLPDLFKIRSHLIDFQIYNAIVFPALLDGASRNDAEAYYLLGITTESRSPEEGQGVGIESLSRFDLLRRACALAPENRLYAHRLLEELMSLFKYLDHEWPAGILVDQENAIAELEEINGDILLASELDDEGIYTERLAEFASRVAIYTERRIAFEQSR
ncbi:hypothetical protein DFO80_107139 [Rhodobacter sp. 140A]|nr:hypothetical protein DFO80_107139 [Rhodobacter sp. 140A]